MAPRQAESEVLGGSKEGAKIVVGKIGNFVAGGNEEDDGVMKIILSVISGPVPGMSESDAVKEAGKQIDSPRPGSDSGEPELGVMHGIIRVW